MICKGCSKDNKKFLKLHNPSKASTHIMYLDANNFLGTL